MVVTGIMKYPQTLKLGPNKDGGFEDVKLKTLQCAGVPVRHIFPG